MGWMPPPDGIEVCHAGDVAYQAKEKASMEKATIIGIDLAYHVSSGHCCRAEPPRRANSEGRGVAFYIGRQDAGRIG
jgi:hypothetical protein